MMELQGLLSVQLVLFSCVGMMRNACDGFCFMGNLIEEMTVSRRLRYYCAYTGTDGHSLKLFPGSNLYLVDQCLDCKCTMDGLQCCGFGHAGADVGLPEDCTMLHDGCQPLIVKSASQTLDCITGKPINFTSLSEQLPHPDNTYKLLHMRTPIPSTSTSAPVTTTTTAPPITAQTTTQKPRHVGLDNILARTMADYFQYLILAGNSASNQAHTPQYWNTGNTFQSLLTPVPQPPAPQTLPVTNNFWHNDNILPWFLFI